jgi:dethiobiotin synthetase
MVVQAPGTILTPIDEKHTVLDLVRALKRPTVLVTRAGLEYVSHMTLAANALREADVQLAGFVVNRYPADSPSIDQELSLREIEKWSRCPLLCVVPEERFSGPHLPGAIQGVMDLVDWQARSRRS